MNQPNVKASIVEASLAVLGFHFRMMNDSEKLLTSCSILFGTDGIFLETRRTRD